MYKRLEKVKIVIKNLKEGKLLYQAVRAAGIKRTTYWIWCKKDERINRLTQKAKEWCNKKRVNMVEDALFKKAVEGHIAAQIFFLKNMASHKWKDTPAVQNIIGVGTGKANEQSLREQISKLPKGQAEQLLRSLGDIANRLEERNGKLLSQ